MAHVVDGVLDVPRYSPVTLEAVDGKVVGLFDGSRA